MYFGVHTRGDLVEVFDDRDLGPKARINGPKFKPDDTRADDNQVFGNFVQFQRTRGGHDGFLVNLDATQGGHAGPRSDDDFLGLVDLVADFDFASLGDGTPPL